jgi:ATP-dependent Clp protease ATP-binding subunit ClpB
MESLNDRNRDEKLARTKNDVMTLLKQAIRPEFLNRLDEIVMFVPLTKKQIIEIVLMQFDQIRQTLENSNIKVELTKQAVEWIAEEGFDPQFGARPVKRALQKYVLNELSKKILANSVTKDSKIIIDCFGEGLVFHN